MSFKVILSHLLATVISDHPWSRVTRCQLQPAVAQWVRGSLQATYIYPELGKSSLFRDARGSSEGISRQVHGKPSSVGPNSAECRHGQILVVQLCCHDFYRPSGWYQMSSISLVKCG